MSADGAAPSLSERLRGAIPTMPAFPAMGIQQQAGFEALGAGQSEWQRGLCNCFSSLAGAKAFAMGCCWPFCGPCLYGKIAGRTAWPTTTLEAKVPSLGNTPFKQWFRLSLILVLIYWAASWGESMMGPDDEPHFSPVSMSDAELNDMGRMKAVTETAVEAALAKANETAIATEIATLDQNVTQSVAAEEGEVAKAVEGDAEKVLWLGNKKDLEDVQRVADFPEMKKAMPEEAVSPAQQFFSFLKGACGVVWVVLVILLRAHTRKRFDIPSKCCPIDLKIFSCEDVLCACFCQPCVLSQMATHTHAITDESLCDVCDATDPGESDGMVEIAQVRPDKSTNSMERGAMV